MKRFTIILLLAIGCSEDDEPIITDQPKSAYEQTDPTLRYLLEYYYVTAQGYNSVDLSKPNGGWFLDTTHYVFNYITNSDISVNLTTVEVKDTITFVKFHKDFFEASLAGLYYDLKLMYVVHIITKRDWECIGFFRELKTKQDLAGLDSILTRYSCTPRDTCCPIRYRVSSNMGDIYCFDPDPELYWFKYYIVEPPPLVTKYIFDFSVAEAIFNEIEVPICNK